MPTRETRVLVADDHEAMRKGIRSVLEGQPHLRVVGEATNGAELVELAMELKPDLIITDIAMPVLDGLAAAQQVKQFAPEMPILVFTMHRLEQLTQTVRNLGLSGYVVKEGDGESLLRAVDAVLHDQTYFPPFSTSGPH
jgi:DNA-binding NarL/FixJ family response regulator